MLDTSDLSPMFQAAEVDTLAQAYSYGLAYFSFVPPLGLADRRFLLRLTIMACAVRRRQNGRLETFIDAHAVSAEVVDFYLSLKTI